MKETDIVAVVGSCGTERSDYATKLSTATGRMLVDSARLELSPSPIDEALALAPWADRDSGAIVEFPADTHLLEFIRAIQRESGRSSLSDIVCVVDAPRLIDDLHRDTYAGRELIGAAQGELIRATEYIAHSILLATQIEYASKIVLMNWQGLATSNLSGLMSLVSALNPTATLWLDEGGIEPMNPQACSGEHQSIQPGWVAVINGSFRPKLTDPRIGALHYEQLRPFHPERLQHVVEHRIERREFGVVVRSAGFCRLATRAETLARWDQVGQMFSLTPLTGHGKASVRSLMEATGQNLALFGIDLDGEALRLALDDAALTDAELAASTQEWRNFPDRFPTWE